jgi:hypothetical protein
MNQACEYCGATPANYRITEEDGKRTFLCHECREKGPGEPAAMRATGCGIAGPHAPGAHPPAVDLTEPDEEELEPAEGRLVSEGSDATWGLTPTWRDRLLGARAAVLHHPALIAAAALVSLGLTILFALQGRWLLALLV